MIERALTGSFTLTCTCRHHEGYGIEVTPDCVMHSASTLTDAGETPYVEVPFVRAAPDSVRLRGVGFTVLSYLPVASMLCGWRRVR